MGDEGYGREALERAQADLDSLRRVLDEGRPGASPEWIAAAEDAVALAELAVRRAGGDPGMRQLQPSAQPDNGRSPSTR